MKRFALLLPAAFFAGCFSFSTTEKQVMSPLYQVESKSYQDIRGNFTVDSFLLYKRIIAAGLGGNESFTVDRWSTTTGIYYTATARYIGSDWRFMDTIHLKVDDELFSYEDSSPQRDVLSERGGMVEERVRGDLTNETLTLLRIAEKLVIQFYASPVSIPSEGLIALRDFLRQ